MKPALSFGSLCVKEHTEQRSTRPHQLPIYATSSFEFESIEQGMRVFSGEEEGHLYSRFGNPTIDTVAQKLALLEAHGLDLSAHALLLSSGMSAISTLMLSLLKPGDQILTQSNLYGGTTELFQKLLAPLGIQSHFADLSDPQRAEDLLRANPSIRVMYLETPANPTMACIDLQALASTAQRHGCKTVVDNTFCTPLIQQPFRFGIDFVVHSTTKYLNGHGNSIAGVIIGTDADLMTGPIYTNYKLAGTNCNAWDAWLINNGLKTLHLRMERHSHNAQAIAEFLQQHPRVAHVNYPGLPSHPDHALAQRQMALPGGMLSFDIKGGMAASLHFLNRLQYCSLAPTLGDVDTLVMHSASMSHRNIPREVRLANGITDGLIRLSVGIEEVADIIGDIDQALAG